ncbi:hypothetical protein LXL04_008433 [Taraxacum kok-saghyz]
MKQFYVLAVILAWLREWRREFEGGVSHAQLRDLVHKLAEVRCSSGRDRWVWEIDRAGGISVASTRNWIDKMRLPTRVLLHRRGVSMDSVLCPMCNGEEEMVDHVFGSCEVARALWRLVFMWMQVQGVDVTGADSVVKVSLAKKKVMEMVICTTLWFLWRLRNDIVHDSRMSSMELCWGLLFNYLIKMLKINS